MNKTPLIETLIFFCRYSRLERPIWREVYLKRVKNIRSRHSKKEGGIKKSFFTIETTAGEILNLEFNQEDLLWELEQTGAYKGKVVDRVLAHMKRNKHLPSDAHRIDPKRIEIFPSSNIERTSPIELALVDRILPYRFLKSKNYSIEVQTIETKHQENKIHEQNLNYVVQDTDKRFYHILFIPDLLDWRFIQEVDEQLLFDRKY